LGRRLIMSTVRWLPYVWKQPRPAAPHEIEQLEQLWGVKLPEQYKQLVSERQGMTPEPSVFKVGQGRDVFCTLLTLSVDEDKEYYSVSKSYEVLKPHMPAGLYPFGQTSGGEHLCFDYRDSPPQPRVVLLTVEMNALPVASSFAEFLEGLYEP
jgi:hypothetical protein